MSRQQTLKSLEGLLESFLARVVQRKEDRLGVMEGINRLDDIARQSSRGEDMTDDIGDWFARHNRWLTDSSLKPADVDRITGLLAQFRQQLRAPSESSPAENKIHSEIDRWSETGRKLSPKLILKRAPEARAPQPISDPDTIGLFDKKLTRLTAVFKDTCQGKKHILSVVNDLLESARLQGNKDALILSAFIIYYLKQNGYKVEPYVKKLREAETILAKGALDA
ncbi:MAG: hypothetical protein JSU74_02640 [Candidatus Zixiibacteriota bacterium]|nr:MAG: hypothetical protein JSU74_02640 [candidate division Zixibacteria bacterium]